MRLKTLNINRGYCGTDPLTGKIEFSGRAGDIRINLDEELSKQVVALCADAIVAAGKQEAEDMTAEVLTALPAPEEN